jgi:DNA-binding response OmpR family regulator
VLVYSSDARIRLLIRQALGRLPDKCGAPLDFVDTATHAVVVREMGLGRIDLAMLDAETTPSGGLGLARQLKDELLQCPPIIVLTARKDDSWLADWSGADAVLPRSLDPVTTRTVAIPLLRGRLIV